MTCERQGAIQVNDSGQSDPAGRFLSVRCSQHGEVGWIPATPDSHRLAATMFTDHLASLTRQNFLKSS